MNELAVPSTVLVAIGIIALLGMAGVFAAPWSRPRRHGAGRPNGSGPRPVRVPIRTGTRRRLAGPVADPAG